MSDNSTTNGKFVFKKGDVSPTARTLESLPQTIEPVVSTMATPATKTVSPASLPQRQRQEPKQKLGVGEGILAFFVMLLPVVGLVFAIVWAVSKSVKKPKQTLARFMLTVGIGVCILGGVIYYLLISSEIVGTVFFIT